VKESDGDAAPLVPVPDKETETPFNCAESAPERPRKIPQRKRVFQAALTLLSGDSVKKRFMGF
jgi:hypothetical protein